MKQAVIDCFFDWSSKFEGYVTWMYLDCKGLVTTGVGNLINTVGEACALPFVHADGSPATQGEIASEWMLIHSTQDLAKRGYLQAHAYCKLHLTPEGVRALVQQKLASNWAWMSRNYYPACESWPAAAQLAVSSMAWAVGAGFPKIFKNFSTFANKGDWASAAKCALINTTGNVGVIPRNKANVALLTYAADPSNDPESLPS